MTKHTEKAGPLPNASIDFSKVQANAKAGKADVYDGALSAERADPNAATTAEQKVLDAAAKVRAEEAGRELGADGALVDGEAGTAEGDAPATSPRTGNAASTGAAATARTSASIAAGKAK